MKGVGYSRWSIVYTSWKRENTSGFLMFLRGKKWNMGVKWVKFYLCTLHCATNYSRVPNERTLPLAFFSKNLQKYVSLVQITSKLQNNICDQGNDLCISTFCAFLITSTNSHSKILDSWVCALKILAENEL